MGSSLALRRKRRALLLGFPFFVTIFVVVMVVQLCKEFAEYYGQEWDSED